MRSFIVASLVLVGLAAAHTSPGSKRRKTLAFGHQLKTVTDSLINSPFHDLTFESWSSPQVSLDPFVVARNVLADSLLKGKQEDVDYYIRKDSYTDTMSGVTYVYIRQLMGGLEVADADMQLNVHDGKVVSYSSSVSHKQACHISYRCSSLLSFLRVRQLITHM